MKNTKSINLVKNPFLNSLLLKVKKADFEHKSKKEHKTCK